MDFVSFSFLLLYLTALLLRFTIGRRGCEKQYIIGLLLLSVVFYGWHIPAYLLLLVAVILVHFFCGLLVERHKSRVRTAKTILTISILANVAILAIFKYADFLWNTLIRPLGGPFLNSAGLPDSLEIVLPIAISFFTFQTISYSVDVFRGRIPAQKSFLAFMFFVSFFPQLIAGPIVRAWEFMYQMVRERRLTIRVFFWGSYLIIRGFFLKLVVADNLGVVIDRFWDHLSGPGVPTYVRLSVPCLFSIQLLCDFMAYTDIARGVAYQLGFRLPVNFNVPYIASTFAEFWRRWHITLSRWFRDYVYISLGGSRRSTIRNIVNILILFLISGLWHGANLTFLVWGGILGAALLIERAATAVWRRHLRPASELLDSGRVKSVLRLLWYFVVQTTWIGSLVFFRSGDVREAVNILSGMLSFDPGIITGNEKYYYITSAWMLTIPVVLLHLRVFLAERYIALKVIALERFTYAGIMLALTMMLYSFPRNFIYFQF